jgi:hypothetical protein
MRGPGHGEQAVLRALVWGPAGPLCRQEAAVRPADRRVEALMAGTASATW